MSSWDCRVVWEGFLVAGTASELSLRDERESLD